MISHHRLGERDERRSSTRHNRLEIPHPIIHRTQHLSPPSALHMDRYSLPVNYPRSGDHGKFSRSIDRTREEKKGEEKEEERRSH